MHAYAIAFRAHAETQAATCLLDGPFDCCGQEVGIQCLSPETRGPSDRAESRAVVFKLLASARCTKSPQLRQECMADCRKSLPSARKLQPTVGRYLLLHPGYPDHAPGPAGTEADVHSDPQSSGNLRQVKRMSWSLRQDASRQTSLRNTLHGQGRNSRSHRPCTTRLPLYELGEALHLSMRSTVGSPNARTRVLWRSGKAHRNGTNQAPLGA